MKKLLNVLGGIFGTLTVIAIIAGAIFIPKAMRLDGDARSYIADVVPKIVNRWEPKELVDCATPELMASAKSPAEMERLFIMFRQLGSTRHLDETKGQVTGQAYSGEASGVFGHYQVLGSFEHGDATIQIQLKREGDSWRINGFRINSEAFLPGKT